ATVTIQTDFDANIRALAAVYDIELPGATAASAVAEVTPAIGADTQATVGGELGAAYRPARCQANGNVAIEAPAKCEVKAGCEADVDPGQLSVQCEGQCSGGCSAECSGEFSCEVEASSIECTGRCEGACTLEAGGTCNGTCRGDCDG